MANARAAFNARRHKSANEAEILKVVAPYVGAIIDNECHGLVADDALEGFVIPALMLPPAADASCRGGRKSIDIVCESVEVWKSGLPGFLTGLG